MLSIREKKLMFAPWGWKTDVFTRKEGLRATRAEGKMIFGLMDAMAGHHGAIRISVEYVASSTE